MLRRFEISAPGKVILHGEHSVVYGKPAIAGVVQVRNYLRILESDSTAVRVNFIKLGLTSVNIPIEDINKLISQQNVSHKGKNLPEDLDHELFYNSSLAFVKAICPEKSFDSRELHSLSAMVYLLVGICVKNQFTKLEKGFDLELDTEMSIGAGLGSSASFGVCLAGAFVTLVNLYKNSDFITSNPEKSVLDEISSWAFYSEKIMHGNPSGLDNTICTFGNMVKFYRGETPVNIDLKCRIPILLIDTKVSRSTAVLVQKVLGLKTQHPDLVNSIFDAIGHLVEDAEKIIRSLTNVTDEKFKDFENLVFVNNNLLRAIGVSHPELEKIFVTAEQHGFKAKLSGAGGGGFAMIMLGNENPSLIPGYDDLKRKLTADNFELIETSLGGDGVLIKSL